VIYRIGDKLAGLDLFGSQTAFERAFPKLLRGSALQALAGFDNDGGGQADDGQFLHAVFNVTADRFPAVGLGEELRFDTDQIGGGALELDGGLVHLFAFQRRPNNGHNTKRAAS
jgi:ARG and Rhodanese-Phosphatase-superfamily-associated Protein domain